MRKTTAVVPAKPEVVWTRFFHHCNRPEGSYDTRGVALRWDSRGSGGSPPNSTKFFWNFLAKFRFPWTINWKRQQSDVHSVAKGVHTVVKRTSIVDGATYRDRLGGPKYDHPFSPNFAKICYSWEILGDKHIRTKFCTNEDTSN